MPPKPQPDAAKPPGASPQKLPKKQGRFLWLREHPPWLYVIVFAIFLLLHAVIFRDVIAAIPSVLSGDTSIVREELVPFFDFGSQFWSDNTSELTSSDEVRVNYSFWTSWVRHYGVLPFALVLLNTLSAVILFHAFYKVGKRFADKYWHAAFMTALLAAFLIHFILLYAKVTHFYTLIFGFSMFAWSMSLVLEQLFFSKELKKHKIILTILLVLLNPAIHYHVIFYFTFAVFVLLHSGITFLLNRSWFWVYLKRNTLYLAVVTAVSLIPYVVFILLTTGSSASSASVDIPVNYWMIYFSSLTLPSLFSLDTASQIDMFRYGAYVIPAPRIFSMVAIFIVGSLFLMKQWRRVHIVKRVFLVAVFAAMLMAVWMAWGYSDDNMLSFHKLVGSLAMNLTEQSNAVAHMIAQAIAVFINILRFPHRFQFIYFYLIGVLLTVGLLWLYQTLREKRRPFVAVGVTVLLALTPVLIAKDYLLVLTTGNFAGFLTPYTIPKDLKNIKTELAQQNDNKLFILPSLENGRDLVVDNKRYGYIDKYLIYYLDQPTLYYGTGGDPKNKVIAYTIYQAINDQKEWWDDLLVNTLGVTHIIMPKHVKAREIGFSYMPEVDAKIPGALKMSDKFEKAYDGPDFALYTVTKKPTAQRTLIDMRWDSLVQQLEAGPLEGKTYFPLQLDEFAFQGGETHLVTDSPERSYYDLYTALGRNSMFYPTSIQLAFSKDFVASTSFTNNALSLHTLNNAKNKYNYLEERMPSLLGLQSLQFIGVSAGKRQLTVRISVPQVGKYRLLLHGASRSDQLIGAIGEQGIILNKIPDDHKQHHNYIDMTYFTVDLNLAAGTHEVILHNPGSSGLAVEALTLLPSDHIPESFKDVNQSGITITQAGDQQTFNVILEKEEGKDEK